MTAYAQEREGGLPSLGGGRLGIGALGTMRVLHVGLNMKKNSSFLEVKGLVISFSGYHYHY